MPHLQIKNAPKSFALGQAGHDLEGVAEDHAVGPVLVVLIELGLVNAYGNAIEVVEEVSGNHPGLVSALLGLAQ